MADTETPNAGTARPGEPEHFDIGPVHTGLLDCIQVNLAVLADHHHGAGTHLRTGAALGFRTWTRPDGLPTVEPPPDEQLSTLPGLLGLRTAHSERLTGAELPAAVARRGGTHYVVADSFRLPWLPYHGHAHMEHSFLLAAGPDGWHVTDAYRSETSWGPAVPGRWVLSDADLAGIGSARAVEIGVGDLPPLGTLPPTLTADPSAVREYLRAYESWPDRARAVEQLTVETWLLARGRRLHAKYREFLSGRPEGSEAQEAHLRAWDKVVEQTYLAHRRVSRGRAEPPLLVERLREVLAADLELHAGPARVEQDEALRRRVAAVAGAVLGVADAELLAGAPFDSFASFGSFRLIEIIERLEDELGAEFAAADLVPENLRRVDDLCRIAR
ncbi:acyl carrier protein [Streptomyces sp. NBC_00859]|uniref:acyl carrier protein n=1 Tax=Streptomyces sp. NBC_00859 TaxID=2903682 RepID=UPI00386EDCAD|nr:acyl carrier protein [Streptomyces sp. NBC_00859]